jgi:aldehyde:ferredoxin oxidoreductase
MSDLNTLGDRIVNLERLYNLREGLGAADDSLPDRLLNESTFSHTDSGVPLQPMLASYYRVRGWDSNGVPQEKTIQRLQLRT